MGDKTLYFFDVFIHHFANFARGVFGMKAQGQARKMVGKP
ncbi:hypothetical protein SDC9_141044 [bioreactor metagenome]|uniref:Uncharacterized protein n=1 Tax=bioreactor metagenome TaxID=1076179 RepID=A0A645DZY9_9ZZZZ